MEYTLLKHVDAGSQQWTVHTRVVRFSKYISPDDPSKIRRLDLVLLDEEGTAMDGQIPEMWVPQFLPKLTEGSVYYIKYFQVRNARDQYRPVDHPYLMRFTAHTKLYEINPAPAPFPQYAYNLATFEVLNTRLNEIRYCSDTMGVLKGCSHIKLQNTSKGTRPLRNVEIVNETGETAMVALWSNHAHEFEAEKYIEMSTQGPVVLLFLAVTCRRFDGKLSLQGSTLCRWYVNPEIPEAMALHNSCAKRIAPATWYGPTATQAAPDRISIQELAKFDNPHTIYSNKYIINAKLISVLPDQAWWYLACKKCNKKTEIIDGAYKCKTYKCTATDGGPRYSISMRAEDPVPPTDEHEAASIQLVFFGPIAEEIIGVPVETLISTHGSQTAFLPARITSLYGRQFELRISVSPRSLQRQDISYQVDAILGVTNQLIDLPIPKATGSQEQIQVGLPPSQEILLPNTIVPPIADSSSQLTPPVAVLSTTETKTQSTLGIQDASPSDNPAIENPPVTPKTTTVLLSSQSTPPEQPTMETKAQSTLTIHHASSSQDPALQIPPVLQSSQCTPPDQTLQEEHQQQIRHKRKAPEHDDPQHTISSRKRLNLDK